MVLLATFASWQCNPAIVRESLEHQPLLAKLSRNCSLCEKQLPENDGDGWLKWVPVESSRQVKFSVFTFPNTQSTDLGLQPMPLGNGINLRLSTSYRQWPAQDQQSWLQPREEAPRATYFRDMLSRRVPRATLTMTTFSPVTGNAPDDTIREFCAHTRPHPAPHPVVAVLPHSFPTHWR